MYALAIDRQRSRAIPFSSAYYETYIDPRNQALREQVKSEELERAMSGLNGAGGVTHTLSIDEAQRKEPARSFTTAGDYSRDIAAKKSAEAEIQKLADRYRSDNPTLNLTSAQAYVHVLTSPQHREIAKRALAVA